VNLESHNLYADLVLKTLGRVIEGEGSFAAGARVIERFAVEEVGVAEGSLRILDGSGLAAENLVTPSALVAVLRHVLSSPYGVQFLETLPEAGTRQLRRMTRTAAARNLRAKTGTIEGVSALSGLVRSADGRPIVFSIIGNDLSSAWGAKRLEDELGEVFASWSFDGPD
jgi:D-alanyl-D-alanine carboxypeptidase/D-alanyl-D-alanine-endopeptidase (penicillin-binding protein 4)